MLFLDEPTLCHELFLTVGKVMIYDRWKKLQSIGVYEYGMPNGPFWIFNKNQNILVHVQNGNLGEMKVKCHGPLLKSFLRLQNHFCLSLSMIF